MQSRVLAPAVFAALALAGCAEQPTANLPDDAGAAPSPAAQAVEHWTVRRDGYALTFHPAFASRATVVPAGGGVVELYRQSAPYHLPSGVDGPAATHQIHLVGGPFERDLRVQVQDPRHEVARVRIELYGRSESDAGVAFDGGSGATEVVTIDNTAQFCPPECHEPDAPSADLAPEVRRIAPGAGFDLAPFGAVRAGAGGYALELNATFASRAVLRSADGSETELYRQARPFRLPLGQVGPAGTHRVSLSGGTGRDVSLLVRDPLHHVARISVELYDPARTRTAETLVVDNTAQFCPPECHEPDAPAG